MADIFYLPKVVSLPGSKLYFFRTNTATPQAVYTDADLSVAHPEEIEADANGVFDPIYLDPTLPDYRVSHYTSADVLIYTVDDVPSNQNVQQSMRLESTDPFLILYDTDGTSGFRKYRLSVNGSTFLVELLNDAEDSAIEVLSYGLTAQSFTGTLNGMTGATTGTFYYRVAGALVTLWCEAQVSGTSNSTSMQLSGLPTDIQPNALKLVATGGLIDNGTFNNLGQAGISSGGIITFERSGNFTGSGTKGLGLGWCVTYPVR